MIADSFNKLSKSAQEKPTVELAISWKFTSFASFLFLACTFNISSLSFKLGKFTVIFLSNLQGLVNALSNTSTLLVAHITITLVSLSKPSISVKI
jgi:hypothetical protein